MASGSLEPYNEPDDQMEHLKSGSPPEIVDPAMKSLADALRVSFKLLSVLMVLFLVLFLATGIESIEPQEQGVVKVFGKIVGVAKQGLVYNWPFPVGEIETVSTQERRLLVDDFWIFETTADKLRELSKRGRGNQGLRPGWDGYLLTGDRNLIHIKFVCTYHVQDPVALKTHVQELDPFMRVVLARSAVRAAAIRTADAIQADHTDFLDEIKREAQAQLDELLEIAPGEPHGIRINNVLLPGADSKTWPLGAFNAYEQAQRAKSQKQTKINKAIGEAKSMAKVIGEKHFVELVGQPWNSSEVERERTGIGQYEQEDYNLIGQYGAAIDALDAGMESADATDALRATAQRLRKKIDIVLTRTTTGGEVSRIIAEAEAAKTEIIQRAQQRANNFVKLYAQYKKSPQVFLERMWAVVLDEVLDAPTVTKWYYHPGERGTVVHINPDPKIVRETRDYLRKKKKEKESESVQR